jgi:hypothetical protein
LIDKSLVPSNETLKRKDCLHCGKPLTGAAQDTYCSVRCSQLATRKAIRPSKEELTKAIWETPTSQLALKYGVSDVAIAKWCKSYGISKPPRGYWAKQNAKNLKT